MFSIFYTEPRTTSIEERILTMSEHTIRSKIPDKLRDTGLFSEDEIEHAVTLLLQYREQHQLDIIE